MAQLFHLSSSNVSDTFHKLVQTEGGKFSDGSGSAISFITSAVTSSMSVATASYAVSASHEITYEMSSSYAQSSSLAECADEVKVVTNNDNDEFYIPFVRDNNSTAACETLHTNDFFYVNPAKDIVFVQGRLLVKGSEVSIANGHISASGNITASGNISSSGTIIASTLGSDVEYITSASIGHIQTYGDTIKFVDPISKKASGSLKFDENGITVQGSTGGTKTGIKLKWLQTDQFIQVDGHVTASGDISSSGTVTADILETPTIKGDKTTSTGFEVGGFLWASGSNGHITSSGHISSSGTIYALDYKIAGQKTAIDYVAGNTQIVYGQNNQHARVRGATIELGEPAELQHITASGNISSSSDIYAWNATLGRDLTVSRGVNVGGELIADSIANVRTTHITASGHISGGMGSNILTGGSISARKYMATGDFNYDNNKLYFGPEIGNKSFNIINQPAANVLQIERGDMNGTPLMKLHMKQHPAEKDTVFISGSLKVRDGDISKGNLEVESHISASGNISASGTTYTKLLRVPQDAQANGGQGSIYFGSSPSGNNGKIYDDGDNLVLGYNDGDNVKIKGNQVEFGGNISFDSSTSAGHITASGNISSSGDVYANNYFVNGIRAIEESSNELVLGFGIGDGVINLGRSNATPQIFTNGHITASANISASGKFYGNEFNFGRPNDYIRELSGGITIKSEEQRILLTGNVTASANISASGHLYGSSIILNKDGVEPAEYLISTGDQLKVYTQTKNAWNFGGAVNGNTSEVLFKANSNFNLTIVTGSFSSEGQYSGNAVFSGNSTTVAGKIYAHTGSGWTIASSGSNIASMSLGLALGSNSTTNGMLLNGIARINGTVGVTGAPLYLGDGGVPALIPTTTDNHYARVVGYNHGTNAFYFCPDNTWVKKG